MNEMRVNDSEMSMRWNNEAWPIPRGLDDMWELPSWNSDMNRSTMEDKLYMRLTNLTYFMTMETSTLAADGRVHLPLAVGAKWHANNTSGVHTFDSLRYQRAQG